MTRKWDVFYLWWHWTPVEAVGSALGTAGGTDVLALEIRAWHIKEKWQRNNSKRFICLVGIPLLLPMLTSHQVHVALSGGTASICPGMIRSVCVSVM